MGVGGEAPNWSGGESEYCDYVFGYNTYPHFPCVVGIRKVYGEAWKGMRKGESMKDCPFCGSEAELIERGNEFTKRRQVDIKCSNKLCRATMVNAALRMSMEKLKNVSIKAWDDRVK